MHFHPFVFYHHRCICTHWVLFENFLCVSMIIIYLCSLIIKDIIIVGIRRTGTQNQMHVSY